MKGLYKGVLPPLCIQGVINGIVFGVEEYAAKYLISEDQAVPLMHFKTGMIAGFTQSFVCAPMELIKLRTQHEQIGNAAGYRGNMATLKLIYRKGGIRGCYQGLYITMFREIPQFGVYFATYEGLKDGWAKMRMIERNDVGYGGRIVAGGIAGVATWACNYPVDLIKTRMQMDGRPWYGTTRNYYSSLDCFKKVFAEGGVRLLFRGFIPTMVRAFACNMFTLPVTDKVKDLLKK